MNPLENVSEESQSVPLDKFKTVTPLSKYLAMVLFVLMPFIGGWFGYTYAPEKLIEVEKIVYPTNSEPVIEKSNVSHSEGSYWLKSFSCKEAKYSETCYGLWKAVLDENNNVDVEMIEQNITTAFLDKNPDSTSEIIEFYFPKYRNKIYFLTQTYSSKAVHIIEYDTLDKGFTTLNSIDYAGGEKPSLSKEHYVKINASGDEIFIFETGKSDSISIKLNPGETFWGNKCGYGGYTPNLRWEYNEVLNYGVYDADNLENSEGCEIRLIENRSADFN